MRLTETPTPADPEAWNAYLAEGNAKQARKRVAADVLLRDPVGRVLLVNPTYKPGWDLPGGMAEANEPPEDAARRELIEELGLHIVLRGLLVVDWVAPHGPWDDQLAFIFDGGTLDQDQADRLRPRDDELSEAAFVSADEAAARLRDRIRHRLEGALRALDTGRPLYLRDGAPAL
ncbi:NUDIX hydrolase [Streptomyces sp. NPDC048045]|uniref:NUDIX hydrolase n=1 Tax=Streptomyces sp. NPDC048045 TaxID=3154710 RepID=UPI0034242D91